MSIEDSITRHPAKLYDWIEGMNESSEGFFPLADDHDKSKEVKVLCILFSKHDISFHDFMWHVQDLDLFEHKALGPLLANFKRSEKPHQPFPQELVKEITHLRSWSRVFAMPRHSEDEEPEDE